MGTPRTKKEIAIPRYRLWRVGYSRDGRQDRWLIDPLDYDRFEEDIVTLNIAMECFHHIVKLSIDPSEIRLIDTLPNNELTDEYAWFDLRDISKQNHYKYVYTLWLPAPSAPSITDDYSAHVAYRIAYEKEHPTGSIWYLRNGDVGKAKLRMYQGDKPYDIDIRHNANGGVYVRRAETISKLDQPNQFFDSYRETIYESDGR